MYSASAFQLFPTEYLRYDFAGQEQNSSSLVQMDSVLNKKILCCIIKLQIAGKTKSSSDTEENSKIIIFKQISCTSTRNPTLHSETIAWPFSPLYSFNFTLVPKAVLVLTTLWYFSHIFFFFPPDYSVFQTKTLFSFFYCPMYLLNNNLIFLNLNLFLMENLILAVKKAAHNKITLLSMKMYSYFFCTLMLKLKCIRGQKLCDILFIQGPRLILKIYQRRATKSNTRKYSLA